MSKYRKVNDVWGAIDEQRPDGIGQLLWRQSHEGLKAVFASIGLELVTTKEELDAMEIPLDNEGRMKNPWRKVVVKRDNLVSKPICINDLITGKSSLRTDKELKEIKLKIGEDFKKSRPKGSPISNNVESNAIEALNKMIDADEYINCVHLVEHRIADIACSLLSDDLSADVHFAEQVKSSRATESGLITFGCSGGSMNVGHMIRILENGMALTCIGMTREYEVVVVWYFHGDEAINMLKQFKISQFFAPMLHLVPKSKHLFTTEYSKSTYRFDVGKSQEECERFLQRRLEVIRDGVKHTLDFYNDDDSQILLKNHRIEQQSFNMTRTAVRSVNGVIERLHEDAYGPVDFRINNARIQDKVFRRTVMIRNEGKHPYNPDDIDIFQISDWTNNIVYAFPMRVIGEECIQSFFTEKELMSLGIQCNDKWKNKFAPYGYDFKKEGDILRYLEFCQKARDTPYITSSTFYTNIIANNQEAFLTPREIKEKRLANKEKRLKDKKN